MAKTKKKSETKKKPSTQSQKKTPTKAKGKDAAAKADAPARPPINPNTGDIDYASPAYLAYYDSETAKISGEQVNAVYQLKAEWEDAHAKAAKLKKEYESARAEHLSYVRKRIDERGRRPAPTLFREAEEQELKEKLATERGETPAGKAIEQKTADAKEAPGWFPDDLWKKFPIERISGYGLTAKDVSALAAGRQKKNNDIIPIETVGQLAAYTEPTATGYQRNITDIKEIGPAGAERIEKAMTGFWSDWPGLSVSFAVEKGYTRPDPVPDAAPAVTTEGATNADNPGATSAASSGEAGEPAESGSEPGSVGESGNEPVPAAAVGTDAESGTEPITDGIGAHRASKAKRNRRKK